MDYVEEEGDYKVVPRIDGTFDVSLYELAHWHWVESFKTKDGAIKHIEDIRAREKALVDFRKANPPIYIK